MLLSDGRMSPGDGSMEIPHTVAQTGRGARSTREHGSRAHESAPTRRIVVNSKPSGRSKELMRFFGWVSNGCWPCCWGSQLPADCCTTSLRPTSYALGCCLECDERQPGGEASSEREGRQALLASGVSIKARRERINIFHLQEPCALYSPWLRRHAEASLCLPSFFARSILVPRLDLQHPAVLDKRSCQDNFSRTAGSSHLASASDADRDAIASIRAWA